MTKDSDAKTTNSSTTATKSPPAHGASAPRAAASPSRMRAAAPSKPTTNAASKPSTSAATPPKPLVKAPASTAPLKSPLTPGSKAGPVATKPSTSAPTRTAAKGATAIPRGSSSSSSSKASSSTTSSKGAKSGARTGAGKQRTQQGAAAPPPKSPPREAEGPGEAEEPDPEEAAKRVQREAAALAEMEALRQAAWRAQQEHERKQEAKRRQQREEEARRKKEEAALRKALLEAAYDDDEAAVRRGIQRAREERMLLPDPVDAADAHGNTLLSEAAAGGAGGTLALLLQMGAHPNSRGEFGRTPLWRAAFLGKQEAVGPLLEGGADPRIANEGGEFPEHVANPAIQHQLKAWNITRTDRLLQQYEARRQEAAAAAAAQRAQAVRSAEGELAGAEEAHSRAQQALKHARMELEKRIHEYDTCVEEKKPEGLTQVALDQVHMAEEAVAAARRRAADAGEALDTARLQLRKQQAEAIVAGGAEGVEEVVKPPGVPVAVKALNDVLIRDVGGLIAASGKWPLVLDQSGRASVFLRYQDTNYINALNSRQLEPNMLRRSLLGALRYGKPLVLDLCECDLWPEVPRLFDQVEPGLLGRLMNRSLLSGERYTTLIRPEDGDDYDPHRFQEARLRAFTFIMLSSSSRPNPQMLKQFYVLWVMPDA